MIFFFSSLRIFGIRYHVLSSLIKLQFELAALKICVAILAWLLKTLNKIIRSHDVTGSFRTLSNLLF